MPRVSGIQEDSDVGKRIAKARAALFKGRYLPNLRGFPGVPQLLARLRDDGVVLAVASSAKEDELLPLLEVAGASGFFKTTTSSDDAEESKPEPDIVTAALRKARCAADSSVMVGDTPYDIEAAQGARIRAIGVRSGGWDLPDLSGAVAVFDDVAQMLERYSDWRPWLRGAPRPGVS